MWQVILLSNKIIKNFPHDFPVDTLPKSANSLTWDAISKYGWSNVFYKKLKIRANIRDPIIFILQNI